MNDNAKHFIAGGISGMATVISGYPLDTIKVKMQCAAGDLTMQQCIKDIIRIRFWQLQQKFVHKIMHIW